MSKFVLCSFIVMIVVLFICVYFYQNQEMMTFTKEPEPNEMQENNSPDELELQPVNNGAVGYTLQNNELHITFNHGSDWIKFELEKTHYFQVSIREIDKS